MNNEILRVEQLKKSFGSRRPWEKKKNFHALRGINLSLREGETFGLVGESGSGKSTLANLVAGLYAPTGGRILFEGIDIQKSGAHRKRVEREIQMVFQNPWNALNPVKKINWILEEPLKVHGVRIAAERQRRVRRLMEEVGLDERLLSRYPHELSGGQRQRIVIITALILKPRLVILDEAVSSLDVSVQAQILNLLKGLQKKYALSYLFISHDLRVVRFMSDRIGVLRNGQLLEMADAERIYRHPIHPYTQTLLRSIPTIIEPHPVALDGGVYKSLCRTKEGFVEAETDHFVLCDLPGRRG